MRKIIFVTFMLITGYSQALNCFFTLVKDSCWVNYQVTVNVTDAITGRKLLKIVVPEGKNYERKEFTCQPSQSVNFNATFSPAIWEKDKGKVYNNKKTWTLPAKIESGKSTWNLTICFPYEFSEVPLPPDANSECRCDLSKVPAVEFTGENS